MRRESDTPLTIGSNCHSILQCHVSAMHSCDSNLPAEQRVLPVWHRSRLAFIALHPKMANLTAPLMLSQPAQRLQYLTTNTSHKSHMKVQLMKLPFMFSALVAELEPSDAMHNADMLPLLP